MAAKKSKAEQLGLDLCEVARSGDAEACRKLVKKGADINIIDPVLGQSPLVQACQWGHVQVAQCVYHV
jgi:ankyrin repeat protein